MVEVMAVEEVVVAIVAEMAATVKTPTQTRRTGAKVEEAVVHLTTVARWATGPGNVGPRPRKLRPMRPKTMSHLCCRWRWVLLNPELRLFPLH
jgi:hypothetical protein